MGLKHLLIDAKHEITRLRHRNEILEAQMGVVEVFAAVVGLKRGEHGMTIDIAHMLQKQFDELDEAERQPVDREPVPKGGL